MYYCKSRRDPLNSPSLCIDLTYDGLSSVTSFAGFYDNLDVSSFIPIPELMVVNADLSIIGLKNFIGYYGPVADPWFRASGTTDVTGANLPPLRVNLTSPAFIRDRIVSTVGCTELYQFCANGNCSTLMGLFTNDTESYFGLTLNAQQKQIFNVIWNAASELGIDQT